MHVDLKLQGYLFATLTMVAMFGAKCGHLQKMEGSLKPFGLEYDSIHRY